MSNAMVMPDAQFVPVPVVPAAPTVAAAHTATRRLGWRMLPVSRSHLGRLPQCRKYRIASMMAGSQHYTLVASIQVDSFQWVKEREQEQDGRRVGG